MKRSVMDRIIDTIEAIAAVFVGLVAADIFISVVLRRFGLQIPDSYDFGRMLLGILIFWGIAATSYRGGHITVDLVWANVGPRWQRAIDDHCTTEWAVKLASPWADFEAAGLPKMKALSGHEVYPLTADQLKAWKTAAAPLQKQWADAVAKAGGNPDQIWKEFEDSIKKYGAGL